MSSGEMVCGGIVVVAAVESTVLFVLMPLCMLVLTPLVVVVPYCCSPVYVSEVVVEGSAYTYRVLEYMYSSVVCAVRPPRT